MTDVTLDEVRRRLDEESYVVRDVRSAGEFTGEVTAPCDRRPGRIPGARHFDLQELIARAAGATVFRSSEPEVGWLPVELTDAAAGDPVATSLPERFDAFQWHHYTHDLPAGAVELARSRVCLQAFRLGQAWGVQFHPEVRAAQVETWLTEDPDDVADPQALRDATQARIEAWNELGRQLCSAFLVAV